uniref:Uncharacterized protein n=1 Tax=Anguilla anguilla TaxID=7936 RepID=A0A0E9PGN2_ANGAN
MYRKHSCDITEIHSVPFINSFSEEYFFLNIRIKNKHINAELVNWLFIK